MSHPLLLCGFLPGSPDDGEFHCVELPEGKRLESLAGGGFGWALAICRDDEKRRRHLCSWGRPPFPSFSLETDDVLLAAAGYDHAVVSKANGSIWFCGWKAGAKKRRRRRKKKEKKKGSSSYVAAWTRLPLPSSKDSSTITALACGFDRTLALVSSAEEGQLWEWGGGEGEGEREKEKESENENEDSSLPLPRLVPFPLAIGTRITSVSAGAHHCAALDSQGGLWTWGGNLRGQCGVVASSSNPSSFSICVPVPTSNATLGGVRLSAVAAGGGHTLALSEAGSLFGFGDNGSGQLGFLLAEEEEAEEGGEKGEEGKKKPPLLSTRLPLPVSVAVAERGAGGSISSSPPSPMSFSSISAGATHSLALAEGGGTERGGVFVLGRVSPSSSPPSGGGDGERAASSSSSSSSRSPPPLPFCPPRRAALPVGGARVETVASGWWHAMVSLVELREEREEEVEVEASPEGRAAKRTKPL